MHVANETAVHIEEFKLNNEIIGTSLNALYQAATCHRKCHGGAHVLESLCGRAYNLSCAAYDLTNFGLYDEALNLIRSLAEMTNLIMLLSLDQSKVQTWINSDRKTRLRDFGPATIRRQLEAKGHICASDDWYRELSERYTHPTPMTRPNDHGGLPWVGGKYEYEGMKNCYGRLMYVVAMLSMFICRWFEFDDLLKAITERLRITEDEAACGKEP